MTYILPLSALSRTDLARAGGKAANLGELLRAGLPVPPGFCVLTSAYHDFVAVNLLEQAITAACAGLDAANPAALEAASAGLRAFFEAGHLPGGLADELRIAYKALGEGAAVAVRSSATAEDLPDLSFAGQQDTYLNVVGEEALLAAVARCWGSLWTARAIGYRARSGVGQADGLALAVVVQVMVPSAAAGVLFTADPLNGRRDRTVIDATLGLGEALVAGKVEPDHYVVDPTAGRILEARPGAKALSIRPLEGGGTQTVDEQAAGQLALPEAAVLQLAQLGQQAARHFGAPQDVEWAWAAEKLWLVQSRPITSLFPLPEHKRGPDHLMALMNFGAVQGLMDPITPLGRELFFMITVPLGRLFGTGWTRETQTIVYESAERLFLDFGGALRHPFGHEAMPAVLPLVEPGSYETIRTYLDDPRCTPRGPWSRHARFNTARRLAPVGLRVLANLLFPAARRRYAQGKIERVIASVQRQRRAQAADPAGAVKFFEDAIAGRPGEIFLWLVSLVASGQAAFQLLRRLAKDLPEGNRLVLEMTRGMPHNVTTEMDLALWQTARALRADPAAADYFRAAPAAQLAADWLAQRMPPAAQAALDAFLGRYGARGVGEIDLGRLRWREDPTPVMQAVGSYLRIEQAEAAPDAVFARGAQAAAAAGEKLLAQLRALPGGWWKAPAARWLTGRMRELMGLRESPKFTLIRIFGEIRAGLLQAGAAWTAAGMLEQKEDIAFLRLEDMRRMARETPSPTPSQREGEQNLSRFGRPTPPKTAEGEEKSSIPVLRRSPQNGNENSFSPSHGEGAGGGENSGPAYWRKLVAGRKALYARERARRQAPRLLMGDGLAVYEGVGGAPQGDGKTLTGDPVSPGVVEGVVHVVLDPFGVQLAPGEILVCPGTDPAWTPLFLAAGGLVMEVGGMMTHGSVVAREYGIPAVVGVGHATLRLKTGQRVRVDGSSGLIQLLED